MTKLSVTFDWLTEPIRRDAPAGADRPAQGRHGIAKGYTIDALTALFIKIAILMIAGINPHFYDIFTRTMFFTL